MGRQSAAKASYAAGRLAELPGVSLLHPEAPFFKEFALRLPRPPAEVVEELAGHRVPGRRPLSGGGDDVLLVAVTERRTKAQIDGFAEALAEVLA